jgi:hypothetical protein
MRIGLRKTNAAVGIAAGLLTAAAMMTTAAASPAGASPAKDAATTVTVTTDARGVSTVNGTGRATTPAAPLAQPAPPPPTTSPPAESRIFVPVGGSFTCAPGRACAVVPFSNGAYVFKFFQYGRYGLSNWFGTGAVLNNQTGVAATRLDNNNGTQLLCVPAGTGRNGVGWDPVWFIRLTPSAC